MIAHYGLPVVQAYMVHIQENAENAVRRLVDRLCAERGIAEHGALHAIDYMDDGNPIEVTVTLRRRQRALAFDFEGTGPEVWANHNAPCAVVVSAIIYVLRTLINEEIPMNGGFLKAVELSIPHPCMLSPSPAAAVVAGNVETSSRITDVLLRAFEAVAGAQGTMNNFTFGDADLRLLRDHWRRQRGRAGLGRQGRGARSHEQHAHHGRRDHRAALSAAAARVLDPPEQRGPGPPPRGQRRDSRHRVPQAHDRRPSCRSGGCSNPTGCPAASPAGAGAICWSGNRGRS